MRWSPEGTIRGAYWIGGGQWAGKTTVAGLLTGRYGLVHYHCDYHDARSYEDRRTAARSRRGEPPVDRSSYWTGLTPRAMADQALAGFAEQFPWTLDDLRALVSPHPVVVDGWSLRPDLVASVAADLRRMVVLVPTEEWRRHQVSVLPRATAVGSSEVSDPVLAQRNRLERDRLLGLDARDRAVELGIRVIEVDGSRDASAVADEVAGHFGLTL